MSKTQPKQQADPQIYPSCEADEIDLIDYLRVIWKWKWLIIAGTLVCAGAAAAISIQMPKVYEVSAAIEPGVAGWEKNKATPRYIEPAGEISAKIRSGVYNMQVREMMPPDLKETGIAFGATVVTGTNTVEITSLWNEGKTDVGVKAARLLIRILSESCQEVVALLQNDYNRQIDVKLHGISDIQRQMQIQDAVLADIRQRKDALSKDMREIERNKRNITGQIDTLLKNGAADTETSLLYSMIVQQSFSYSGQLDRQIYDLEVEAKRIAIEKIRLASLIYDINTEIDSLNEQKGVIRGIAVITEPAVSSQPIKSRTKQTTLLAGVVAMVLCVFIAFFIEYLKTATNRKRLA